MDYYKSKQLEQELKGKIFNGYEIIELINNGKSAAVFKAKKNSTLFALKIFDNELIERFGHEIQTKRIEQEISLKNHNIDGLINIHEGGNTDLLNQKYYFIIMDFVEGKNLKQFIQNEKYDNNLLYYIVEKLFEITQNLLTEKNIAHRDIKPENIMITESREIILMDLGVLKLVGAKSFSDEEEKSFVGTLRYAAPEFLLRIEEDSINGWKSLNIYQIGATLHDLINKNELFHDKIPYSNLVIAIKDDIPKITSTEVPFAFVQLVRDMLSKDWKKRLDLVSESRIKNLKAMITKQNDNNLQSIFSRRIKHQAKFDEIEKLRRTKEEIQQRKLLIANNLFNTLLKSFEDLRKLDVFKEMDVSEKFNFANDYTVNKDKIIQNFLFELTGDLKDGYLRNLYVLTRISNDENGLATIDLWAIFPSIFTRITLNNPFSLFESLRPKNSYGIQTGIRIVQKEKIPFDFKTIEVFKGVVELDETFEKYLKNKIIDVINKSLDRVEKHVEEKLDEIKQRQESKNSTFITVTSRNKENDNIVIDRL